MPAASRTMPFSHLVCPLDDLPLAQHGASLQCVSGHCFDIGKPGYVNLLPVQGKRSKAPGDSAAMVKARHAFLASGAYAGLSDALNQRVLDASTDTVNVLDAGCGEGYYLKRLVAALGARADDCYGIDISRPAIQQAARGDSLTRSIQWLVANNTRPCVAPGHLDHVLCLFGFPAWPAFHALLRPGAKVWLVEAGHDHLRELRAVLYPEVRDKPLPSLAAAEAAGLVAENEQTLWRETLALDAEQLRNLLMMTPHFYRAPASGREAALALEGLTVSVDVRLRVLAKNCPA